MKIKKFSKKEAISFGLKIARKYFWFVIATSLIYIAFQIAAGLLQNQAGSSQMDRTDVYLIYKDSAMGDRFYQYLKEVGYINQHGLVMDKLKATTVAAELELTDTFEVDRDRIFNFLQSYRYRLPFPKVIYLILAFALWVLDVLMMIGLVKISLILSRDQKPKISELFSNTGLFINYILSGLCYGLAVLGGFFLLIVPGIVFSIALGMYQFFIVDKNMGPIEALKASRALTKGVRWQLALLGLLLLLINLAGVLCFIVGLAFTVPASMIVSAHVYDQLMNQSKTTTESLSA